MDLYESPSFVAFTTRTLDEVILLAEEKCRTKLTRRTAFQWLGHSQPLVSEGIVEHIVSRVFVDDEHIFPCIDIGVSDVLGDGALLIVGIVAGYAPRPFGRNRTGREGPFIHIVGGPFLNKMAGKKDHRFADMPFGFITPSVAKPH